MSRAVVGRLCLAVLFIAGFARIAAGADGAGAAPQTPPAPTPTPTSPLAIHVGDSDLQIGGFMDATAVMRSTNPGTGIGSSFGTLPFSNTPAGAIGETRFSTQNSRLTMTATSKVGATSVKGYVEADFLGNAPANLNVTSNANTLRMRLYWVQLRRKKFEFLAGQSWSLLVPGRAGISPAPGDLFYSQVVDTNYQMGLTWGRTTTFRFVAHASDTVSAAVALENPQQYVGSAVVLPSAFPASEVDVSGNTAAPNPFPDVIGKLALDPKTGKLHQHVEIAGLVRGFKTISSDVKTTYSKTGTGASAAGVFELTKQLRFAATGFWSSGGGRYIANTNLPDFIVNADNSLSLVKSRSFIVGPEVRPNAKTLFYVYYSESMADSNVTTDTNGKAIGFGIAGSAASNRKITETTVGLTQTLFNDPKTGGVQLMLQFSNVERTPFSVPDGSPSKANANMVFFNVRYVLP